MTVWRRSSIVTALAKRQNPAASVTVLLAMLAGGCGKGPIQPGEVSSPTRLAVSGPSSVPPGQSAQYTAIAVSSDGTSRDGTASASWNSSDPEVLTVSHRGMATAHRIGDVALSASLDGLQGTMAVVVVPAGTYRLSGQVRDVERNAGVSGARIEVVAGSAAGLVTTTDVEGRYRLFGVSGAIRIRVSSVGFRTHEEDVHVGDHRSLNVQLRTSGDSERYTLTIEAAAECRGKLPDAARTRVYTAELRQEKSQIEVTLGGGQFLASGSTVYDQLVGRFLGAELVFELSGGWWDYGDPPAIVERQSASTFLVITGRVVVRDQGGEFTGTLDGTIAITDGDLVPSTASCRSAGHLFVLRR